MIRLMLNFTRCCALVLGVFGIIALVTGFITHTPHNIVIGVVMELLMIVCAQTDKINQKIKML